MDEINAKHCMLAYLDEETAEKQEKWIQLSVSLM